MPTSDDAPMKPHNAVGADEPIRLNLMAAMCHGNRGIGYQSKLPWPPLKDDYTHYTRLVSTPQHRTGKKIVHIRGRLTWEGTGEIERRFPDIYHVVISNTLTKSEMDHPTLKQIVKSFEEAVQYCTDIRDEIDSVWVMGGSNVYQSALQHAQFNKLYLTRVHTDFPADTFFPKFEHFLREVDEDGVANETFTNSGIEFQFKVYTRSDCSLTCDPTTR